VEDELDHAGRVVVELPRQRAEQHVLRGGRDRDQVGAELRIQLEGERSLDQHVGPARIAHRRQERAGDRVVGEDGRTECPLHVGRGRVEKRRGGDEGAHRGDHGVGRSGLLGDSPSEGSGLGFVAEVADEPVKAVQTWLVHVPAQVLAQLLELVRAARRHHHVGLSFQQRSHDEGADVARRAGDHDRLFTERSHGRCPSGSGFI
jgi:hypothetical protein